jgi:hypothetical protein
MDSITEPGTFGLLLTWHQLDLERPYYQDRLSHEHLALKEEHLDATMVGNFSPFLTHRLTVDKTGEKPTLHLAPCGQIPDGCVPKGLTTLKGHPAIEPLPDNYPLYFIKTDSTLMTGHNDIFNPEVRAFLVTIIDDIVRRSLRGRDSGFAAGKREAAETPLLSRPQELNRRFGEFYSVDVER